MTSYKPAYTASHALVIGVNNYQHISTLSHACADALSIAEALKTDLGFPPENIQVLLDKDATKVNILKGFCSFERLGPDDRALVFFAGHGITVPSQRGDVGFLCPVDGDLDEKSSLIRWLELTSTADIIPAKHIFFIMDACYSGLAIQRFAPSGVNRFISDMLQRPARQVMTAGKADQTVADGGGPTGNNSIFTGHLLEGIKGKASNEQGVLTANMLAHYVYSHVANDPNSDQTPHYGHVFGDGDFVLKSPNNGHMGGTLTDSLVKTVADRPEPPSAATMLEVQPQFARRNGYADPESDSFGRNEFTENLSMSSGQTAIRPKHWLALVVEPVSNHPVNLDIGTLAKSLLKIPALSVEGFALPSKARTTAKSVVLYDEDYYENRHEKAWKRFVRIERTGVIEYADCNRASGMFSTQNGLRADGDYRVFLYVQTIGLIGRFLKVAKQLLVDAGYTGGLRYLVNLVGAKDSILIDFARLSGKNGLHWSDIMDEGYGSIDAQKCQDKNLQIELQVSLASFGEEEANKVMAQCANDLGLAYNHQSEPRCFVYGTTNFPWPEFNPGMR